MFAPSTRSFAMPASSFARRRTPSPPPSFTAAYRVGRTRTSTPGASSRVQSSNGRGDTWPTTRLPRACAAAIASSRSRPIPGIVERVEHGPDHHGLAARRRELLVPHEIFESLLPVEEQGPGRHREQARSRDRRRARGRPRAARRRRTPGRGARCCRGPMLPTTWSVEKPSAPSRSPSRDQLVHRRDLVGLRHPRVRGFGSHHRGPHREMPDEERPVQRGARPSRAIRRSWPGRSSRTAPPRRWHRAAPAPPSPALRSRTRVARE